VRLTPKQAAERLSVSLSLVYQLLRQRKIPAYRVGVRGRGKWLIEEEDLNGFLATCKVEELKLDESNLKFLR
jgi:excisionase family DNA binding protein